MREKSVFIIGALLVAMPLLSTAQQFSAEDIEQRAANLESKRVEVIKRLSESIAQLDVRDVSVIRYMASFRLSCKRVRVNPIQSSETTCKAI